MVIIYGTSSCVFCEKAKRLAEQYSLDYQYITVDDKQTQQDFKQRFPGAKTVPQIIWNNRHVGGYTEFAQEIENTIGNYGQGQF